MNPETCAAWWRDGRLSRNGSAKSAARQGLTLPQPSREPWSSWDLFGEMHGWPPPENEARRRDDELARERWVRVRNFYRAHGKTAKPEDP